MPIYVSTEGYKYLVEKGVIKEDEPEVSEQAKQMLEDFVKGCEETDNRSLLKRIHDSLK